MFDVFVSSDKNVSVKQLMSVASVCVVCDWTVSMLGICVKLFGPSSSRLKLVQGWFLWLSFECPGCGDKLSLS